MEDKEYTLGLDIGTNSIGWAVVDEKRKLVKKGKQTLWGVRMFEESSDAKARRTFRNSRRRITRRKERISFLQEIFTDEIKKVDPTFFTRLNESFFKLEDKTIDCNDLFCNLMTNKEYYKKYPTIWHLRQDLINNKEKVDIRLIYLAIHHIIKYRGNFLQDGDTFNNSDISNIVTLFNDFNDVITNTREFLSSEEGNDSEIASDYLPNISFDEEKVNKILEILNVKNKVVEINGNDVINKDVKARKLNLKTFLGCNKDIYSDFIIDLLVTTEKKVSSLKFAPEDLTKKDVKLYSEELENDIETISKEFDDFKDIILFLPRFKDVTDTVKLNELLGDETYLCEAFVNRYNQHKKDLIKIKELTKKYLGSKVYNSIFRDYDEKVNNYVLYIGHNNTNDKGGHYSHCSYDNFIKFIKDKFIKEIEKVKLSPSDVKILEYLKQKIDNNEFLLRSNSSSNGAIPMQLHLQELDKILFNQSKFYDFLNEKDEKYNITNINKIRSIFKFKRPYYVGPLKNSEFSWAVLKKENEKVYPWNFNDVVDLDASAEVFINRMRNKCTYLKGDNDYCIPKDSIIFQEYSVLSFLNTLKIDGKRIDIETRNDLFNNVFLQIKKPTSSIIKKYLHNHYNVDLGKNDIPEVTCSMSSYITFKNIFGDDFDNNRDLIENIISDITIFEDKSILVKRLQKLYKLEEDKIKIIKSLNYKKTGRLCKRLLNSISFNELDPESGEIINKKHGLLSVMREEMLNMQEVLFSSRFDLNTSIDDYNKKVIKQKNNTNEDPLIAFLDENITVSPIYIRPFIQSMRIIDELEDILKHKINYYCIECTRTNKAEKKKKSVTRYEQLRKQIQEHASSIDKVFDTKSKSFIKLLDDNENAVKNSDKYYLYFSQLGKDMYSGEDIDISNLNDYDIDHIYPQSLIKDDSISNRVLVNKKLNHQKGDRFLCETNVLSNDVHKLHKFLFENNFITKTKYNRLTEKEVNPGILEQFANRQKVATDQAVKALITVLKLYKNVDSQHIIYSKAENISDFRHEYNIYKSRTANNYHHAHDAYLNAVLGKMFNDYFSDRHWLVNYRFNNLTDEKKDTTNYLKIVKYPRYKLNSNELIWNGEKDIEEIKTNIFERFDILETTRTYIDNNMLSKVTIRKAGKGTVDVKNTTPNGNLYDINKYGGFDSPSYSKYAIIKDMSEKISVTKLIPVPRMYLDTDGTNTKLEKYISDVLKIKKFTIEHNCIKINCVIYFDHKYSVITGVSSSVCLLKNFYDRNFDKKCIYTIYKIDKYLNMVKSKNDKYKLYDDKIELHISKNGSSDIIINSDELNNLFFKIKEIYSKIIYSYSVIVKIINKLDAGFFQNLKIINKLFLLSQLLLLLKTNERKAADLTIIGESKNAGILTLSQNLKRKIKFIDYSYTGLRKKVLYEVK